MPRILYVQFTDPAGYPPLEHSSVLLAKRGWDVVFLGVKSSGLMHLELPAVAGIRVRRIRFYQGGWRQKLQYLIFFIWTLGWTWVWRPQWIYASDPLSCPVVWWVRRLTGVPILYHEHDSPSRDGASDAFFNRVLAYRRFVARHAELCVLPQKTRLCEFLANTGRSKPAHCVWNCPSLEEACGVKLCQERDSAKTGQLIAYYHGSITPDRLPIALIVAASRFKGAVRVRIAGYETLGSKGYLRELAAEAAKNGASDLIETLGTIRYRNDLLRSASQAHVGIALMPKASRDINMLHMAGASNKPFDYMACGLPLLVSDLDEWVETFVNPGYARSCDPDSADSIEAALRWYIEHPEERRQIGWKCREKIKQVWNYEAMFVGVAEQLENGY